MSEEIRKIYKALNKDGSVNAIRTGVKKKIGDDLYHSLLVLSWPRFLTLLFATYFGANLLFAIGYLLCGENALIGLDETDLYGRFIQAFFFSIQTFATIGYGKISPQSIPANLLVTFEAFFGLMGFALATGLLYARFSRPSARVLFSNVAIIGSQRGIPTFFFRLANERSNQIVDAQISVVLIQTIIASDGERFRILTDMTLTRSRTPVFAYSWLVHHTIDEKSPLFGKTKEDLIKVEAQILVSLVGTDDIFNQSVQARRSFTPDDMVWNKKFVDMMSWSDSGTLHIDLTVIHETKEP